jgi:hypothetical protein
MEKIYVQIDDERIEATGDVLAELLAAQSAMKAESDAIAAQVAQAATDKAALLAKLGITADEAKLLLG